MKQLGSYELVESVRNTPSGAIWRARHQLMGRDVLIKIMPHSAREHADIRKRFAREIRLAAQLSHPNLVNTHHADTEDGDLYMVMEDLQGADLAGHVKTQGPLDVNVAVDFVLQAARGLGYLHQQGVVHRNVKPANLTVDLQGVVHVTNMTLALVDQDSGIDVGDAEVLTRPGQVVGTAEYMAPEQGFDAHSADARSDIYSLGCSLFFLLTGHPPYPESEPRRRVTAHTQRPIPSLRVARPDVSESLDSVFQKMLAKMPTDRYQTIDDLIPDLQRSAFGGGDLVESRKLSFRWELILTALAVGLLIGFLMSAVWSSSL